MPGGGWTWVEDRKREVSTLRPQHRRPEDHTLVEIFLTFQCATFFWSLIGSPSTRRLTFVANRCLQRLLSWIGYSSRNHRNLKHLRKLWLWFDEGAEAQRWFLYDRCIYPNSLFVLDRALVRTLHCRRDPARRKAVKKSIYAGERGGLK